MKHCYSKILGPIRLAVWAGKGWLEYGVTKHASS
jgi:hypothetical protein